MPSLLLAQTPALLTVSLDCWSAHVPSWINQTSLDHHTQAAVLAATGERYQQRNENDNNQHRRGGRRAPVVMRMVKCAWERKPHQMHGAGLNHKQTQPLSFSPLEGCLYVRNGGKFAAIAMRGVEPIIHRREN